MYPLSDKDLDRISREAAEQFAVEPHASDWDQLASRLEKEMPVQKEDKKRRALWLLLVLLLTCGGGLLWLLTGNNDATNGIATTTTSQESIAKNNTSSESTNNTDSKLSGSAKENSPSVNTTEPVSSNTNSTETETTETKAKASNETLSKETAKTEKETVLKQSTSTRNEVLNTAKTTSGKKTLASAKNKTGLLATISTEKNRVRKNTRNKSKDILNSNTETTTAASATNLSNDKNSTAGNSQTVNPAVTSSTDIAVTNPAPPATTDDTKNIQQPKAIDTVATNAVAAANKKAPAKKGKPSEKGFSFGLTAGFDYSRINNVGDNKPGYDFGLTVAYALSKRWSFNTGFLFTKKNYTAEGKDFHPPKHYWTTYIALNDVEGNCQMWDIPLNIRYNLTTTKTKWFINSGFSTYIMRKQNYNYYYTVNSTPREKEWSLNSQTNYWFNILNISAGAEKPLGRNWSIQAEPFIKVPLKGVGFGNMNINNYGVLATLKFHPEFKR